MSKASRKRISVENSAVITAAGSYTPESTTDNKSERVQSVYPIRIYEGKNYLPTAYGYKSFFGTSTGLEAVFPTDEVIHQAFIYQTQDLQNIPLVLTDTGIWTIPVGANTWQQLLVLAAPPANTSFRWTMAQLNSMVFLYREDQTTVFWIEEIIDAQGIYLDNFNGSAVTPTQKATLANCPLEVWEYTPTLLNMAGQLGIYRAGSSLGFWDSDNSIAYSAINDVTDFAPDLTTLANLTKVNRLIGRITHIASMGRDFVIYATSSIIHMAENTSTNTSRFVANVILPKVGVAYPREIVVGSPDTIHYANTSAGIYEITADNASPIITDISDYLKETKDPIYLSLLNNRYLCLEILDPDFIQGNVEFSAQTKDTEDYVFAGVTSPGYIGDDYVVDGDEACFIAGGQVDPGYVAGIKPYVIIPLYNAYIYGGAEVAQSAVATLGAYTFYGITSVTKGAITDFFKTYYPFQVVTATDLLTFEQDQLDAWAADQLSVLQAKYATWVNNNALTAGYLYRSAFLSSSDPNYIPYNIEDHAQVDLALSSYTISQTAEIQSPYDEADVTWSSLPSASARPQLAAGTTLGDWVRYTGLTSGYDSSPAIVVTDTFNFFIIEDPNYNWWFPINTPYADYLDFITNQDFNLGLNQKYDMAYNLDASDLPSGEFQLEEATLSGNDVPYRVYRPYPTTINLKSQYDATGIVSDFQVTCKISVEFDVTGVGHYSYVDYVLPNQLDAGTQVALKDFNWNFTYDSDINVMRTQALANNFGVASSNPLKIGAAWILTFFTEEEVFDWWYAQSGNNGDLAMIASSITTAFWATVAGVPEGNITNFTVTSPPTYSIGANQAVTTDGSVTFAELSAGFRTALWNGASTVHGNIVGGGTWHYVSIDTKWISSPRSGNPVDKTLEIYGQPKNASWYPPNPPTNYPSFLTQDDYMGVMALRYWYYNDNNDRDTLDDTFLIGGAGQVSVPLGWTLAEADANGAPTDVTAQAEFGNRFITIANAVDTQGTGVTVLGQQLVCGVTKPYTVDGGALAPIEWDPWTIETPPVTYVLSNGVAAPYDPTFYGAYVFDLHLKKWGQFQGDYKALYDYQTLNNAAGPIVDHRGFVVEAGAIMANGLVSVFDHEPEESYLRYGKYQNIAREMTQIHEVELTFNKESTGIVAVQWSLDGRQLEYGHSDAKTFDRVLRTLLPCGKVGKWATITIAGQYDLAGMIVKSNNAGDR